MAVRVVGSPAGTMVAVMAFPLSHVDDESWGGGWPWHALCFSKWRCLDPDLEICSRHTCSWDLEVARGSDQAKALRFVIDFGDAHKRRFLLEDDVVVLVSVSRFWVKTIVHCGLASGDALHRFPS